MDHFDFIIIGAGPGGEAAANEALTRGASVAVIDQDLFGGSCPHWGCIPSKSLLHAAARHAANPASYPWSRASERRDYMVNRAPGAAELAIGGVGRVIGGRIDRRRIANFTSWRH
jgi:dihydrolipoamide dehydrogenase